MSSIELTKAESRKVGSEHSKVLIIIIKDTYSVSKLDTNNFITPNSGNNRFRNLEIGRNKKHHVSQEKKDSFMKNTFQSKIIINTTKKIIKTNSTKQYFKKVVPNVLIANSKSKY